MVARLQRRAIAAANATRNAHDPKAYAALFAPDATVVEYGLGEATGRDAIAAGIQGAFIGFPDYKIGASRIFVNTDVVVQEWVVTGTNKGPFNGAQPTNKKIGIHGASVLTFASDGLIQTEHRYFDTRTIASQLGLIGAPARDAAALPIRPPKWHVASDAREQNERVNVANAFYDALEQRSTPVFLEVLSEDPLWSDAASPKDELGQANATRFFSAFISAFADVAFSPSTRFGVDDFVVSQWSMRASRPRQPTHVPVTLHGLDIFGVTDGKVGTVWSYSNTFELLQQISRR